MAKETVAMVAGAYEAYKQTNGTSGSAGAGALTPYMNYVKVMTNGGIDGTPNGSASTCTSNARCLVLHNGAWVRTNVTRSFGGTGSTNAIWFQMDPDGVNTSTGSTLEFYIYYNGLIRSGETALNNTCDSMQCWSPAAGDDPSWFSW